MTNESSKSTQTVIEQVTKRYKDQCPGTILKESQVLCSQKRYKRCKICLHAVDLNELEGEIAYCGQSEQCWGVFNDSKQFNIWQDKVPGFES